jgi:adenylate kinase
MRRLGFDLILLGAPAAGKDTQAAILMRRYNFKPIESGKYWRKMASQKSSTGRLLKATFSKGLPTPTGLMKKFIITQTSKVPRDKNLIFIGNPRLEQEARLLTKILNTEHRDFFVIFLTLPKKEIISRSLKRMRDDQDWKYVNTRASVYKNQYLKTLEYYRKLKKAKIINGNQSIKQVSSDIQKAINDYQRSKAN